MADDDLTRKSDETLEQWVDRIRPSYKGDIEISLDGNIITMNPWPLTINLVRDTRYDELMRHRSANAKSEDGEEEYFSEADW